MSVPHVLSTPRGVRAVLKGDITADGSDAPEVKPDFAKLRVEALAPGRLTELLPEPRS